jgi:hypothetical protein
MSNRKMVLVCGSREWANGEAVTEKLAELDPSSWVIEHGGADGADQHARRAAAVLGLIAYTFRPDYAKDGKAAPHVRNDVMLAQADRVIAFWDGRSPGTKSVIDKARKRGLKVEVVRAGDGE